VAVADAGDKGDLAIEVALLPAGAVVQERVQQPLRAQNMKSSCNNDATTATMEACVLVQMMMVALRCG
jgi:hypothetical protein